MEGSMRRISIILVVALVVALVGRPQTADGQVRNSQCNNDPHIGLASAALPSRQHERTLRRVERTISTEGVRVAAELAESVIAGNAVAEGDSARARVVIGNAIVRFLVKRIRAQSDRVKPSCAASVSKSTAAATASEVVSGAATPSEVVSGAASSAASSAAIGAVAPNPALAADVCAIYAIVMRHSVSDSVSIVVYDSVSLAAPTFAFRTATGGLLPPAGAAIPFTDSLWQDMRTMHSVRESLPACVGAGQRITRVPFDSLLTPFRGDDDGWSRFAQLYPRAQGFHIIGRPMFTNAQRTDAFVYVAHASSWQHGSGDVMHVRKLNGVWQVVGSHTMWVASRR